MWILVLVVLLIILFFLIGRPRTFQAPRIRRRGRVEFYSRGLDAGFSIAEINLLWAAATRADLDNPPSIYGSVEELDKAINQIAGNKKFSDRRLNDPETIILKKLFDYRKKVELNKPRYRSGLKSTRNIAIGQRLTVRAEGVGVYSSKVIENEQDHLTISIPVGDPLPPGFSWRSVRLNIYFWRREDAGYFFQTRVVDRFYDRKNLNFHIYHSDNILRSQKRRSVRAPARMAARFYPLRSLDEANQFIESAPGLSCVITDISEDGAAIRIGGRGRKNQPFKLQFKIREEIVVVSGAVKRVQYDESGNESILHLEFLPQPENNRMILNSYVFDIDRSRSAGENREVLDTLNVIAGVSSDPASQTAVPETELEDGTDRSAESGNPDAIDENTGDDETVEELETVPE